MIGYNVEGMDTHGQECNGIIKDKVRILHQSHAIDAYLALNEAGTMFLIPAQQIRNVYKPVRRSLHKRNNA